MQLPKIVLMLVACATAFFFVPHAYASPFQDTKQPPSSARKTVPLEHHLKLSFEDAAFREFVGISPEQLELLDFLLKEWAAERKRLSNEGVSPRDQIRARAAKESNFKDTLTEHQQERILRFNLISSFGLEEFGLLELANAAGDLTLTETQIQNLQSLKNKWVKDIDQDLVLPKGKPSDDRERRWEMLDERVRRVQAIRQADDKDLRSELNECLAPDQSSRLSQIQLQKLVSVTAIEIFNDPAIKNDLELTRHQMEQLVELRQKIANEENRFLATRMKLDAYVTYSDSLSPKQKDVWRKKLGRPAWLFNVNWLAEHIENDLKTVK